jgi:hypothetical protein
MVLFGAVGLPLLYMVLFVTGIDVSHTGLCKMLDGSASVSHVLKVSWAIAKSHAMCITVILFRSAATLSVWQQQKHSHTQLTV